VATYGERAVDVFYVRDVFGHKITHPERLASLRSQLLGVLAGESAAP
jgi:[protein-PII] uridylyltransferase